MKLYKGNTIYRGCSYDLRVCAKSRKQVAELLDTSVYDIKTYYYDNKIDDDKVFEGVLVVPYGSNSVDTLGLDKYTLHDEMTLEEFKERVDKFRNKQYKTFKKKYEIK